jgi:hypothetical protein
VGTHIVALSGVRSWLHHRRVNPRLRSVSPGLGRICRIALSGRSVLAGGLGIYCRICCASTRSAMDSCMMICAAELFPATAPLDKASGPLGCPRYRSALALSAAPGKKSSLSSRLRSGETGRRTHYTHMLAWAASIFQPCLARAISAFMGSHHIAFPGRRA